MARTGHAPAGSLPRPAVAPSTCLDPREVDHAVVLDAGQLHWWLDQAPGALPPAQKVIGPTPAVGVYIRWSNTGRHASFAVTLTDRAGHRIGTTGRLPGGSEYDDGFTVPIAHPHALRPGTYTAIITVGACVASRIDWLLAFGRPAPPIPPPPASKPVSACELTPRRLLACVATSVVRIDVVLSSTTQSRSSTTTTMSQGSGIVIGHDHSGTYILTAAHVVTRARPDRTTVTTAAGRTFRVEAIAASSRNRPDQDVAVLRIATSAIPLAVRAGAAELHPGERILVVGYHAASAAPPTAAAGQFVAAGVDIGDGAGPAYLLHTAPLLPGDSGGPLYNQDSGQVVGMDVAALKSQPGRRAHQIGLSLPMSQVWPIARRLLARLQPLRT